MHKRGLILIVVGLLVVAYLPILVTMLATEPVTTAKTLGNGTYEPLIVIPVALFFLPVVAGGVIILFFRNGGFGALRKKKKQDKLKEG